MRGTLFKFGCFVGLLMAALFLWLGWSNWSESRNRAELELAQRDLLAGRYASARKTLTSIQTRAPGWGRGEVEYHLGLSEFQRGRPDLALAVWERVPESSAKFGLALSFQANAAIDRGNWSRAEELLVKALERSGAHDARARWDLVRLLRLQGRFDEARLLAQVGFANSQDPVDWLHKLYKLDVDPYPIDGVRRVVENAARSSPSDDRVRLAQAHLAIRQGDPTEAEHLLSQCLRLRPDNQAAWRLMLECSQLGTKLQTAREALGHVHPWPGLAGDLECLKWRAWMAGQAGDLAVEEESLRQLISLDPGLNSARDRLAELAARADRLDEARQLRSQRDLLERTRIDYENLMLVPDANARAEEIAALAARLGRSFDAEAWRSLAGSNRAPGGQKTANTPGDSLPNESLADRVGLELLARWKRSVGSPAPQLDLVIPDFHDDAEPAGLRFVHDNGARDDAPLTLPVTGSGGVALLDVNGDGLLDVYAVQAGPFPPAPSSSSSPSEPQEGDRLFLNEGDGRFVEATKRAGLAGARGYGHGIAVGDYNNDGHPDLFITRWRAYALYRNNGDSTFSDVTNTMGLGGDRDWPTSAAFADLDNDGDLDLYVCHYLVWETGKSYPCVDPRSPYKYHCNPLDFPARPDRVFRNDGDRFLEVSEAAGIIDTNGRGLGVVAADLDDDDRVEIFVANDMSANLLFKNLGGFHFEETGLLAGVAGNASGGFQAGMGVACGDLNGDGLFDLAVTNFHNESTTFFQNLGQGLLFADRTNAIGLAAPSRDLLGFGLAFLDANNDGVLDLMSVNGHVSDGRPQFPWKMSTQLLLGSSSQPGFTTLKDVSSLAGAPLRKLVLGRGLAIGDLDNDGKLDAVALAQNEPLAWLHNRSPQLGHFLTLELMGRESNRDAVGARVVVEQQGRRWFGQRCGGGSYQSSSDPRLHFGLAAGTADCDVEVRWPSGRRDRWTGLKVDGAYRLVEGSAAPSRLKGWDR